MIKGLKSIVCKIIANVKNIPICVAPKQSILLNNKALVGEMSNLVDVHASYDTIIEH
jgi:hypothetical protein